MIPNLSHRADALARIALLDIARLMPTGGPFTLTDHTGRLVTDQDFRGRDLMVYFGFIGSELSRAFLRELVEVMDRLPREMTGVFVTVDTERDTVAGLRAFVSWIDPRLIGLIGSEAKVGKALCSWGAPAAGTCISPSPVSYLTSQDGRCIGHFDHGCTDDDLDAWVEVLTEDDER